MVIRIARQFGQCIRARREELGWSQDTLARKAAVSRSTVYRLEMGTTTSLYPAKLLSILDALGLEVSVELKNKSNKSEATSSSTALHNDSNALELVLADEKAVVEESDGQPSFVLAELLAMGDAYKDYAAKLRSSNTGKSQEGKGN